ncbi:acyltransferase family protein [Sphingomonas psychrolutea]|nr:acyltransferase family protein [Sphingomonas psychrolutea]
MMQTTERPSVPDATKAGWAYWPEIDGLRTIAVLAVALFHLNRAALPGGFVGVDIFFVISGFLISAILIEDTDTRSFSIGRFYQRRISRIFPALILVILTTLAVASFVYSAQDLALLGISSAAAATSLINLKLMLQGSYFILSADAQPLLHYWSLAVEEQFYVVFPLYLYAIMRRTRRPLTITLSLAVLSFVLCVALTPAYQPVAFYSLPTRAWELLAGASIALCRAGKGRIIGRAGSGTAWVGLALVLGSIVLLREADGFPGWIAAFPVIGTVLLIAPIGAPDTRALPLRLLAHPTMVAIGKRSYSLYLWHWPVFSLIDYRFYAESGLFRTALKIGLTLVLTGLSYELIERPARRYLNLRQRRVALFVATAIVVAAIAGGGVWLRSALYFDIPPSTIPSGGTIVRGGGAATVILSGDSQAAMYGTEIGKIARARGFTLHALGTAGRNQLPDEAGTSWPAVARLIADKKPDLVILIDAWADKLKGDPRLLQKALAEISASAKAVLIVSEAPSLPDVLSRDTIRSGLAPPYLEPAAARSARVATAAMLHRLERPNVHVVDVADVFTDPRGALRVIGSDGRWTYFDSHHLSDSGTAMTSPQLGRAIESALKKQ